jgi:cytoskeletal protein CcmA (bactofilin family)
LNPPAASEKPENRPGNLQHVVAEGSAPPPLVPAAGVFEGQVVLQGETRIEGSVKGALRGPGCLAVGPGGRVEGEIECRDIENQGFISGSVAAVGGVWLGPGSRFEGPIRSGTLALDETAIWNGEARVGQLETNR